MEQNKFSLKRQNYVGDGYSYTLKRIMSNEFITILCDINDYKNVASIQIPEGFELVCSQGGFPLLDNGIGQLGDYFLKDGNYYVFEKDEALNMVTLNKYSDSEFNHKYIWL